MRVVFCITLLAAFSVALAEDWRPVKGAPLRALFPGKELGDGAHFSYRFSADGTFAGTEMGNDVRGRWRIHRNQACLATARPRAEEECYDVERQGADVRLLKYGSEAWYSTLK